MKHKHDQEQEQEQQQQEEVDGDSGDGTIVFVIGPTASGKSDVAIQLAQLWQCDVINADIVQMYKGAAVATNQVSDGERKGVKHHLLGCYPPDQVVDVNQFVAQLHTLLPRLIRASPTHKVIVCGGTNYYLQAALWGTVSTDEVGDGLHGFATEAEQCSNRFPRQLNLRELSDSELHTLLSQWDEETAARFHPNDRRRVLRSLELMQRSGVRCSELVRRQAAAQAEAASGSLHHSVCSGYRVVLIELHVDKPVLQQRVARRVDRMVEQGMVQEVKQLCDDYPELCTSNRGVFQAIGVRELVPICRNSLHQPDAQQSDLQSALQLVKTHTLQYVKKQNGWLRNRFEKQGRYPVYVLDSSNADDLAAIVKSAVEYVEVDSVSGACGHAANAKFIREGTDLSSHGTETWEQHECQWCNKQFTGAKEWKEHLSSRAHRKRSRGKMHKVAAAAATTTTTVAHSSETDTSA